MININIVIMLVVFAVLFSAYMFYFKSNILRLILVTYLFIMSSLVYFSFDTYMGWPSPTKIEKARLISVQIVLPSPATKGGIFLWVYDFPEKPNFFRKIFSYNIDYKVPRAYYIPYSKDEEKKFSKAKDALKEGAIITLTDEGTKAAREKNGKDGAFKKGEKRRVGGGSDDSGYISPTLEIQEPSDVLQKEPE